jgi:surfeit locus 1 family protein
MVRDAKVCRLLIFSALGFLALIALGLWQLERREWKEALLANLELALSPSAQPLDLGAAEPELDRRDYVRVRLQGRFDNAQERYLFAVLDGESGWHVITPFITGDRRLVFIDRGFVPDRLKDPGSRPQSLLAGETEIAGLLRRKPKAGMFTPANEPLRNIWYWADVDALRQSFSGDSTLKPVNGIVQALPSGEGPAWPKPVPPDPSVIPNNHLQYALTWFALAVVLLVITVLLVRSGRLRDGSS